MNQSLLRNRTFVFMMIGEAIQGAGIWTSIIANLQFMQSHVPSDLGKSLILMCGLFLGVLISPQAGVWADRYDKKKILFISGLVRCLAPIVMFAAIHYQSVAIMLLSVVIMQVAATVYMPTVQAALPSVVPASELLKANSLNFNVITIARIGGTAVAGILVSMMNLYTVYALSLAFYVILVMLITQLRIPNTADSAGARKQEKIRFTELFPLIRAEPSIFIALINSGVITLFLGGFNLLVLKFSQIQHKPELMGWIYSLEGTSILIAGLFAKRAIGMRNLVTSSTLFMLLFALSFAGMSFSESSYAVLGSFVLFGCAVAFFFPMVSTLFQIKVPKEAQGRFFSFRGMLDRVMFQISLLATGACLDWFGISTFLLTLAIITISSGILTLFIAKRKSMDVRQPSIGDTVVGNK
ncbi:MFS transporter [Paenibacillus alginolyticus]|uniref:MFS transporter n=1 Tax=Paenibacillus alginolyticus TaxID=59839 RepID=A0ABT4G5Z0_9BACL|nr:MULTISPECIES: MFS transporter [Paenibacillus]MCY9668589.1 MFS transporter [Paenibacillus alginolyticus]MCY9691603.1 MFS transporter [Paenibacillus alginolyticus]MEC0146961.1 MFS transporter [Paenibacillus alginolyticus]NRF95808.1 MFS transporter [Paenibacillus frigoriresistens]